MEPLTSPKKDISLFGDLDLGAIVSELKTELKPPHYDQQSMLQDVQMLNSTETQITIPIINETICFENKEISKVNRIDTKKEIEIIQPKCITNKEITLSEIQIDINSIHPGSEPPRTILDEPDGLKVILHFARDCPRENVSIIVITTMNQNSLPLSNYKFDASVTKVIFFFF